MIYTVDNYTQQLKALLPRGQLFDSLSQDGKLFAGLLRGIAGLFALVDQRVDSLEAESQLNKTLELLPDYLKACGLPGDCMPVLPATIADRRALVIERYISKSSDTGQALIDAAAKLDYVVTITRYKRFTAGFSVGDPIVSDAWFFTIIVNVNAPPPKRWGAGSYTGEPLRVWGFEAYLECVLKALKPAHNRIVFNYTGG